jgi:hypothetical protein
MTNWSFEHVNETRAALKMIVSDPAYGAAALSNVRIMSELLPQLIRGARLERSVLVTAAKESLASTMLKRVADGMDPSTAVRLGANFLNTNSHVPIEACFWAAAELALALGLISVEEADALRSSGSAADPSVLEDCILGDDRTSVRPIPVPDATGSAPPVYREAAGASLGDEKAGDEEPDGDADFGPGPRDGDDESASRGDEQTTDVHGSPGQSGGGYGGGGRAQPGMQAPGGPAPGFQAPAGPQPGYPAGGQPQGARPIQQPGGQPTQAAPLPSGVAGYAAPGNGGRQPAAIREDWLSRVVRDTVHPGLLAFNPPAEMQQGRVERIEVGIARSPELRDALTAGLRGRGVTEVLQVDAGPVMGVELRGSSFQVTALSPVEQIVVPMARWEFDVTPVRSGSQTLTLCVSIRIETPFPGGGQIAVPVLERDIHIRVDVVYGTRRFVANNWQWLVGTAIGLGGGIAAWVSLVH